MFTTRLARPGKFDVSPEGEPTDRDLLLAFRQGEVAALERLIHRHTALVLRVCWGILRHKSDTEDAFQATFLVLARKAGSLGARASVAGWLFQTARRISLKLRGQRLRRSQVEKAASHPERGSGSNSRPPGEQSALNEMMEILESELARLPERFREAILLGQIEGLDRREIAVRLGIGVGAVKDRLERGREQLRAALLKRGVTLGAAILASWVAVSAAPAAQLSALAASTAKAAGAFAWGQSVFGVAPAAIALAQGFLKVLGWEKMKTTALTLASLLVFGGIALAALKDNPTRFEKGLCGRVVAFQNGKTPTVTIELGDTGALLNLDIGAQAKIWTAYEQGALEDLQPGQEVSLRLAADHRTVAEIHLRGIVREVRVKSVGSDGKITIVDEDDDGPAGQTVELPLAPDAIFRLGGLPAAKSDWKPGMTVPLELGRDGKTVHAIEAEALADSMVEGLLAEWIGPDQIKIATEDDDDRPREMRVFAINGDTLFQRDGNKSTRLEIKKGSRVVLRLDQDKKTVRAVQATSPEPTETPDPEASKKN